jgi:cytochrome c oxidase assembly protein Cox11
VKLQAYTGMTNWSQVRSSDAAILAPIHTPGVLTTSGTITFGFFQAVAPGEADVTATATPDCSPGQACPALAALYSLKVTVTG